MSASGGDQRPDDTSSLRQRITSNNNTNDGNLDSNDNNNTTPKSTANGAPPSSSTPTTQRTTSQEATERHQPRSSSNRSNSPNDTISTSASALPLVIQSTLFPEWTNILLILTLIFGGCCSNVYALEAIIKAAPGSGTLVTCFQFGLIAAVSLPGRFEILKHASLSASSSRLPSPWWRRLRLKPNAVPLRKWAIYTALFVVINVLNNKAFDYRISVPLHIILRSAGPVSTMLVQRVLVGRRFSNLKVASVLLLFVGVVVAAIADALAKNADTKIFSTAGGTGGNEGNATMTFWIGFTILYLALFLAAILGVYTDGIYAKHGRGHTDENLFYSHALALPLFLFQGNTLRDEARVLLASPPTATFLSMPSSPPSSSPAINLVTKPMNIPFLFQSALQLLPLQILYLLLNGLTQYVCIRGVNLLSARTSSLTVSIVLNIRKLVSLLLSIWLFGNRLSGGVLAGAALVFLGGGLYALPDEWFGSLTESVDMPAEGGRRRGGKTEKVEGKKEL